VLPVVRVFAACLTVCFAIATSYRAAAEDEPARQDQPPADRGKCVGARIRLMPIVRTSTLGQPVSLIFTLQNCSTSEISVLNHALWAAGELRIAFRAIDTSNQWQLLRPLLVRELRGLKPSTLRPGESIAEIIPVYFDATGRILADPGAYEFQATYLFDGRVLLSNLAKVIVSLPRNQDEIAIAQAVASMDIQRFLYSRGGPEDVETQLSHIVESTNNPTLAAPLRIAILLNQNARMLSETKDANFCRQVGQLYANWSTVIVDPRLALDLSRLMSHCDLQNQRQDLARGVWRALTDRWPDLLNDWNVREEASKAY
jgi:hypothetical protein